MSNTEPDHKSKGQNHAGREEAVHLHVLDVPVHLPPLDALEAVIKLLAGVEVLALVQGWQGSSRETVIILEKRG